MNMKSRGFTLIELLVVISIISLLSSIVLAALSGARQKGTTAASLEFDATVYHTTGDQIIGDWEFRDGPAGTTLTDSSGYNNYGTLNYFGSPVPWVNDTPNGTGYSLYFNGSSYVTVPSSIDNLMTGNNITISTWVKASGSSFPATYSTILAQQYVPSASVRFALYGLGTGIVAGFFDGSWHTLNEVGSFPFGVWTLITTTYDGSTIKLYINGILNNSSSLNQPLPTAGTTYGWNIGKKWDSPNYFSGYISEVRIYNEALTAANIYKLYALGAAKHGVALK